MSFLNILHRKALAQKTVMSSGNGVKALEPLSDSLSVANLEKSTDPCIMTLLHQPSFQNSHEGFLLKWTNYLYGWQKRYVILNSGTLLYSLGPEDAESSFHGVVSLLKAQIKVHSKDELRFDLTCGGECYYFKANTPETRMLWVNKLFNEREQGFSVFSRRTSSLSSISSASSIGSAVSSPQNGSKLSEVVNELDQLKGALFQQIDNLQHYYDVVANFVGLTDEGANLHEDEDEIAAGSHKKKSKVMSAVSGLLNPGLIVRRPFSHRYTRSSSFMPESGPLPVLGPSDRAEVERLFKNKGINLASEIAQFRVTTVGVMSSLSACVEHIDGVSHKHQRELEKERERNSKLVKKLKDVSEVVSKRGLIGGPDFCESPDLRISEEQFYDALETAISLQDEIQSLAVSPIEKADVVENPHKKLIDTFMAESLEFLTSMPFLDVSWSLNLSNPPTKIYKKELLVDDIVVDPYRVIHLYRGASAKEICRVFWDVKHRLQTDSTVDYVFVKATYGSNSVVVHQLHKHIWPATRRDSCFLSQLVEISDDKVVQSLLELFNHEYLDEKEYAPVGRPWMVLNHSVDHPDVSATNCIRVYARVALLAQTFSKKNSLADERKNVVTMINYTASINPGGWLPHSAVRAVARRELPKFVKNLGDFCALHTADSSLDL